METPFWEAAGLRSSGVTGFEVMDHTADVGIRATGDTLADAFANAARGMFSIITDLDTVQPSESRQVTVTAPDMDALLVNWLNELIYLFEVDGLLLVDFAIHSLSDTRLTANCAGERVDPERHPIKTGVKAATYHGLEVRQGHPCHIQVILDI
ncbi:MAG: archease [Chloroflexota bacterium]